MIRCADDFGLNKDVDEGILQLLQQKKLNAVSVMSLTVNPVSVVKLRAYSSTVRIGLHLDLFSQPFCLLSRRGIETEIERQIRFFYSQFGCYPSYYDGHMHCHIYPVIRTVLLKVVARHLKPGLFVRSLTLKPELAQTRQPLQKIYLALLSMFNRGFLKQLRLSGIRTNDFAYGVFNGHMEFSEALRIAQSFSEEKNSILFCHPGIQNDKNISRRAELELLGR